MGWTPMGLSLDLRRKARTWDEEVKVIWMALIISLQPSLTLSTVPTGVVLGHTEDNKPEGEGWPEP